MVKISIFRERCRPVGFRGVALVGLAAAVLAGCSYTAEPYVYDVTAYDREHPDFAKTPKTMNEVTVCYSKYGTTPAQITRLAAETCGRYGAGIQFLKNTYTLCPVTTPVGAQFACVGGAAQTSGGRGAARAVTGQPGAPAAGFEEGARPMGVLFGRPQGADTPGPLPGSPAVLSAPSETTK